MDIRIEKTKSAISNVFLELRASKPLEKITVKELCEKARINKSTFYSHYHDIYDLSEHLENEVVASVIDSLPGPEKIFEAPGEFTNELMLGYIASSSLIQILFSGTRKGELVRKIELYLKHVLYTKYPEMKNDPMNNTILSYTIYGSYYAFIENRQYGDERIVSCVGEISQECLKLL